MHQPLAVPAAYDVWYRAFEQSVTNPSPDPFSRIKREKQWIKGVRRLKEICEIVLVDACGVYKLHAEQLDAFLYTIPTMLPVIFGVGFYRQYAVEQTDMFELLQLPHNKLFFLYIGSRRVGKSILMALIIVALMFVRPHDVTEVPIFGPTEKVPMRMLAVVASMFNIPAIKRRLERMPRVAQKKIVVKGVPYTVHAPTEASLRGLSSKMDFGDEMFNLPSREDWEKLFIVRYAAETGVGAMWLTTPRGDRAWTAKYHTSTEKVEVLYRARICPECNKLVLDNPESYRLVEKHCHKQGHIEPLDIPWKSQKAESHWSQYLSTSVDRQEMCGQPGVEDEQYQFRRAVRLSKVFHQFAHAREFTRFDVGIDPADYGRSEMAIAFVGTSGLRHQLLAGDAAVLDDATTICDRIMQWLMEYILKFQNDGILDPTRHRVYVWVESPGHHGERIQRALERNNVDSFVRVMKYTQFDRTLSEYVRYNVPKTRPQTEYYVSVFRDTLLGNRFKIANVLYTHHPRGAVTIREKFEVQLNNFIKDSHGKLHGKQGGNDDFVIAVLMAVGCAIQSMDVRNIGLTKQLIWL